MGPKPKLTRKQALDIRAAYVENTKLRMSDLGEIYGVTANTIMRILHGSTSTVAGLPNVARRPTAPPHGYGLTPNRGAAGRVNAVAAKRQTAQPC